MEIANNIELLSQREKQIAVKIMEGKPNKLIAYDLYISERTVKFHCANIYRKLQINSRHALIAQYYREIIQLESEIDQTGSS
ncbi:LuxR C-terminal-related transcriptional regulator [Glaciecola sp. 1036]|uniref:LuxR C-terminal-related transcriptional regulator n=1 Tax=Alteromonadaceae TaxID=72275 RepID=UPI003D080424